MTSSSENPAGGDVVGVGVSAVGVGSAGVLDGLDGVLDGLALGLPGPVAVPAIAALVLHPAPPDVRALRRYAGHVNPSVRSAAINALAGYPDPTAQAAVAAGLRDPVGSVRSASAAAAGRARVKVAIEPMMLLLAKGEEASARGLAQLADGRFGEYYEPFTGEPLGSDAQSWTAAVALDWLADEEVSEKP